MVLFVEYIFVQGRFAEKSHRSILILTERLHLRALQSFLNMFFRWYSMLPLVCPPVPLYPPPLWSFWDDSFFILAPMNHCAHNLHVHVRITVYKLGGTNWQCSEDMVLHKCSLELFSSISSLKDNNEQNMLLSLAYEEEGFTTPLIIS